MENTTKALIIAAAILIAIVLISLGVFVLGNGTQLVKENSDMSPSEISAFNSKFEVYFGDKVSLSKVKQLENAVEQHNRTADEDKRITIQGVNNRRSTNLYRVSGRYTNSGLLNIVIITN